jgi:hypothetical protein
MMNDEGGAEPPRYEGRMQNAECRMQKDGAKPLKANYMRGAWEEQVRYEPPPLEVSPENSPARSSRTPGDFTRSL